MLLLQNQRRNGPGVPVMLTEYFRPPTELVRRHGVVRFMQALANRLSQYVSNADHVCQTLRTLNPRDSDVSPDEDIVRTGDIIDRIFIIREGWAIRYRTLEDGRRQIVNFMLPGDIFDLHALSGLEADHTVTAVTRTRIMEIETAPFVDALRACGEFASGFWWAAVQEESILREQIVRVGRRTARERIAHLLLELQRRLTCALGGKDNNLVLPVTRTDLADALGLTPVHVSRTMSWLSAAGLIEQKRGVVSIVDRPRLARLAHFDDDYLHLRRLDFAPPPPATSARIRRVI